MMSKMLAKLIRQSRIRVDRDRLYVGDKERKKKWEPFSDIGEVRFFGPDDVPMFNVWYWELYPHVFEKEIHIFEPDEASDFEFKRIDINQVPDRIILGLYAKWKKALRNGWDITFWQRCDMCIYIRGKYKYLPFTELCRSLCPLGVYWCGSESKWPLMMCGFPDEKINRHPLDEYEWRRNVERFVEMLLKVWMERKKRGESK